MVIEVRNHSAAARHRNVVRIVTITALLVSVLLIAVSLPWACDRQLDHLTALSPTQFSVVFDGRVSCYVAERGPHTIASATLSTPRVPIAHPAIDPPSSGPLTSGEEGRIDSFRPHQWDVVSRPLTIELRI